MPAFPPAQLIAALVQHLGDVSPLSPSHLHWDTQLLNNGLELGFEIFRLQAPTADAQLVGEEHNLPRSGK